MTVTEHDSSTVKLASGAAPWRAPTRLYLVVFDQEASWRHPVGDDAELVVGRGGDAAIRLADPSVSRAHARIVVRGGQARIVDLGSANGVAVNGIRVRGDEPLAARDLITLGRTTLVLGSADEPAAATLDWPTVETGGRRVQRLELAGLTVAVADPPMVVLHVLLGRLAPTALTVLLRGETGAGKEVAARVLHHLSPRRDGPFVTLGAAALTEADLGDPAALAPGGTLFLDEVAELAPAVQARLVRILDDKAANRLDLRLVAATARDLEAESRAGRFREDLYFRMSGAGVAVPPLRERPLELDYLARWLVDAACVRAGRGPLRVDAAAAAALRSHGWPGNVRELENTVAFLVAAAGDRSEAGLEQLPPSLRPVTGGSVLRVQDELREMEKRRIVAALEVCGGNQSRAAILIGMPRRTFVAKLTQHGLRRQED